MKNLKAHHHLAIVSMLIFGVFSVWSWGAVVFAGPASQGTTVEVWVGPADSCPNIAGYQIGVPDGMLVDDSGNCYTPPPPPVDICDNIDGMQEIIPTGYYRDTEGDCFVQPSPTIDVCANIPGKQASVPEGYLLNSDGDCVLPPKDMCTNIDGVQVLVPKGMERTATGVCFTPSTPPAYVTPQPPQDPPTEPLPENPWVAPVQPRTPVSTPTSTTPKLKNIPQAFQGFVQPIVDAIPASVKEALRSVPPAVAIVFPYAVFGVLGLAAGIMLIQAMTEVAAVRKLRILLKREKDIAEEKDNFIALASHYLRTPITLMKGAIDTSLATSEKTTETIAPLSSAISSLEAQVGKVLGDVENNTALQKIATPEDDKRSSSFLDSTFFWSPIITTFILVFFANFLLGVVGDVDLGQYNLLLQVVVFITVSSVFYSAIRSQHLKKHQLHYTQTLIDHEETIDRARNEFIQHSSDVLATGLVAIAAERSMMRGSKAETYFNEGYDRFDHLLQKFNLLSQIQAGVIGEAEKFDIQRAVDDILLFYKPQLSERRITIVNNVKKLNVKQRRSLFDFVLGSLIDNAIKFSHEGGTITIGSSPHQGSLTVKISDYGIGIPDSKMSQLFKPFSRGTSAMEFNYEGMGFSLFLDKIIMDYVGGNISAQSIDHKKTTFSITTPTTPA